MTTDATGAALLAIVRANPADWDARRVYADWLDDGSEEGAIAANAQRWQAANRKYAQPAVSLGATKQRRDERSYDWWCSDHNRGHDFLPSEIWDAMEEYDYKNSIIKEYRAPDAAETSLARALWVLGINGGDQ